MMQVVSTRGVAGSERICQGQVYLRGFLQVFASQHVRHLKFVVGENARKVVGGPPVATPEDGFTEMGEVIR